MHEEAKDTEKKDEEEYDFDDFFNEEKRETKVRKIEGARSQRWIQTMMGPM